MSVTVRGQGREESGAGLGGVIHTVLISIVSCQHVVTGRQSAGKPHIDDHLIIIVVNHYRTWYIILVSYCLI